VEGGGRVRVWREEGGLECGGRREGKSVEGGGESVEGGGRVRVCRVRVWRVRVWREEEGKCGGWREEGGRAWREGKKDGSRVMW
jgi:hypothetical protein